MFEKAADFLMERQSTTVTPGLKEEDKLFHSYGGGMGNQAFIRKGVHLHIEKGYFTCEKDGLKHIILCSSRGVFQAVSAQLKKEREKLQNENNRKIDPTR